MTENKIEYLSFDHMLQHARSTLGLAYELVFEWEEWKALEQWKALGQLRDTAADKN